MFITEYKNVFLTLGAVVMAVACGIIIAFPPSLGIDFTGGSILEVQFDKRPAIEQVEKSVVDAGIENPSVRPAGENQYVIRTPFLEETDRQAILRNLREEVGNPQATTTDATSTATDSSEPVSTTTSQLNATNTNPAATTTSDPATTSAGSGGVVQKRFSSIGPTVGSNLATNAVYGIIGVVLAIILFVTFAFRKVSDAVSSWAYGSVAIIALLHDILVPSALFAVLGVTAGAQIDLLFVMALLAILGFSVNDTIVVFDRIRENLREHHDQGQESFADIVGTSLQQTFARSVNTSLTTLIVLAALYLLGGESTELFSLTLLVGVIAGTYSSLFFASPLLVKVYEWRRS